jgi:predicted phage tail protein
MARTKTAGIPPVPLKVDRDLRPFLEALRENIEVTVGRRGKPIDRAVTFRDLQDGNLGNINVSSLGAVTITPSASPPVSEETVVETPTVPQGFSGVAGFTFALLSWNIPQYGGHALVEIYRQTVDANNPSQVISVGNATLIGTTSGFIFRDDIVGGTEHYYWIRNVNSLGAVGPYNSIDGLYLQAAVNYDDLIDDALIDILAGLAIWQNDIITSLDLLDDAVIQSVLDNASAMTTVSNTIGAAEGRVNSSITNTQTVAASATATVAIQTQNLQSTIYNLNPDGSIQLDGLGNPVFSGAFIDRVDVTLAGVDGSLRASVGTTVSLQDANGNDYSLSDILTLALDANNNLTAQWGIKFSKDDLLYGVGLVFVNNVVTFTIAANSFAVYNPANGTEVIPFVVNEQGQVLISEAFIDYAAITTLVSENIIATRIAAGVSITSPEIFGGIITGGSLNINDNTRIESNGLLTTTNAVIQGHIDADSGTLNNVTIAETCTINGTVFAQNIEGDVIDRSVIVVTTEVEVGPNSNFVLIEGKILPGVIGGVSERTLVISGMAFDHNNGGGSTSNFDVVLYLNNVEEQRFHSHNVNEEGSVTVSLACIIPAGNAEHFFQAVLHTDVNDNIMVQAAAIIADVFKKGNTIIEVNGMYANSSSGGGGGGPTNPGMRIF